MADKFDAAGAEIHICMPLNKSMVSTNPEQLILSKTYPTSGYNLAHVSKHTRLLAGGYFAEQHCKRVLISQVLAPISINRITNHLGLAKLQ